LSLRYGLLVQSVADLVRQAGQVLPQRHPSLSCNNQHGAPCPAMVQEPVSCGFMARQPCKISVFVLPVKREFLFETNRWRREKMLLYLSHTQLIYKLTFHI
jgi:hypothetical protein